MLHSPKIEAMIDQECAGTYNTPEMRAAYRAGMSAAFMACDYAAHEYGSKNLRSRLKSEAAKLCGDMIEGLRERVHVHR